MHLYPSSAPVLDLIRHLMTSAEIPPSPQLCQEFQIWVSDQGLTSGPSTACSCRQRLSIGLGLQARRCPRCAFLPKWSSLPVPTDSLGRTFSASFVLTGELQRELLAGACSVLVAIWYLSSFLPSFLHRDIS